MCWNTLVTPELLQQPWCQPASSARGVVLCLQYIDRCVAAATSIRVYTIQPIRALLSLQAQPVGKCKLTAAAAAGTEVMYYHVLRL